MLTPESQLLTGLVTRNGPISYNRPPVYSLLFPQGPNPTGFFAPQQLSNIRQKKKLNILILSIFPNQLRNMTYGGQHNKLLLYISMKIAV